MEDPRADEANFGRGGARSRLSGWAERVRSAACPVPRHRWGIGAFFVVFAVYVLVAVFAAELLQSGHGRAAPRTALVGTIVPGVAAACCALAIARGRGNGPRVDFALRVRREDIRTGLRFGVIGMLVTIAGVLLWQRIAGEANATSAVASLVGRGAFSVPQAVSMFVYTWLIGPLCEEIIFRGVCWGAFARWGPFTAFGLSTAIFAASHLEPERTVLLLVIGVPIGMARLVTGSTGAGVIAHQVSNFLPALALLLLSIGVLPR